MASLRPALSINLMHEPTFLEFARNPRELESRLAAAPPTESPTLVFIDEVQRLPSLLNTIQVLLDGTPKRYRFLLTGFSARKLRRGNANLLPGRIHSYELGPIVAAETDYQLDTSAALSIGCLPGILTESDEALKRKTLRTYAATYLREEIQAESLSRNLEGFARFLTVTAEWAGRFLDLSKMAAAAQIPRQSAVRYFEVLQDSLVVRRCDAFSRSLNRRLVKHPKFYFFDTGVLNGLLGNFELSPDRTGALFEALVFSQITYSALAKDIPCKVSTFRTTAGAEVDFVVELGGRIHAIELKAGHNVGPADLRGLKRFADYHGSGHIPIIMYLGDVVRQIDGVDILPWQQGLRRMGL